LTDRRYSEEEMALILKRAVEKQSNSNLPARSPDQGFTLAEMQEIGAEVGIDATRITAAANSLDHRPDPPTSRVSPARAKFNRWIDVPVEEKDLQEMMELVRRNVKKPGQVTEVLGGAEWRGKSAAGAHHVSIRPEQEGTRLEVEGVYTESLLGALVGTSPLGALLAGAFANGQGASPALVLLMAVVGFVVATIPWWVLIRNSREHLEGITDQLEHHLQQKRLQASEAPQQLESGEA